jgi:hypothetical protein
MVKDAIVETQRFLGLQVYQMVSRQLPLKKGGKLTLHHVDSPLILHKALQEQGIVGYAFLHLRSNRSLCCMSTVQGLPVSPGELVLEGITRIAGATTSKYPHHLPIFHKALRPCQAVSRASEFKQSLEGETSPSSLQGSTFSDDFTIFTPSLDLGMSDLFKQPEDLDLWVAV